MVLKQNTGLILLDVRGKIYCRMFLDQKIQNKFQNSCQQLNKTHHTYSVVGDSTVLLEDATLTFWTISCSWRLNVISYQKNERWRDGFILIENEKAWVYWSTSFKYRNKNSKSLSLVRNLSKYTLLQYNVALSVKSYREILSFVDMAL